MKECELTLSPAELADLVATHTYSPSGSTVYTIKQAAQLTGVLIHTLRYWESNGLLRPARLQRVQPGVSTWPWQHRRYSNVDLTRIDRIKRLLYKEHYRIAGAKLQLEADDHEKA